MSDTNLNNPWAVLQQNSITREANSQRQYVRIQAPINAIIGEQRHVLADWSIAGMKIINIETSLEIGGRFKAVLDIPFPGFSFTSIVQCEVVRNEEKTLSCRFIDITEAQISLLSHLIDNYLSGKLVTTDNLLNAAATASREMHVKSSELPNSDIKGGLLGKAKKSLGYAVTAMVGSAVLAVTGYVIHLKLFTVDAALAAVSAPVVTMRSPIDGKMLGQNLLPGMKVAVGSVLYKIQNNQILGDYKVALADLQQQKTLLATLLQQYADRAHYFKEYATVADSNTTKSVASVDQAEAALKLAENQLNRTAALQHDGYASVAALDIAKATFEKAKADLRQARMTHIEAESNARLAHAGLYYTGSHAPGEALNDVKRNIQVTRQAVEAAQSKVNALQQQVQALTVISPCDCIITAATAHPGESLKLDDIVYQLRPANDNQNLIEALVPQEDVDKLAVGKKADVRLADYDQLLSGRIVAINRSSSREQRAGLPDKLQADPGYAMVLLSLDRGLANKEVGLPAQVKFKTNSILTVFNSHEINPTPEQKRLTAF